MNLKNKQITIYLIPTALAFLATPVAAGAVNLLPACATDPKQLCQLNDIVQTVVNFARLLFGFVGSAVLLMFVYGGFVWLTSGGTPEKVKKGHEIIKNAIIGLIIVFAAFTIIQFIFSAFGATKQVQIGQPCLKNGVSGINVPAPDSKDPPTCSTTCGDLSSNGYKCGPINVGKNCITGFSDDICRDANQACCQGLP